MHMFAFVSHEPSASELAFVQNNKNLENKNNTRTNI